jgi:hypothetical protein
MFEDKRSAAELNEVLERICKLITMGRDLVNREPFSQDESRFYNIRMGKVLGTEILEIQAEIWRQHPELVPPGVHTGPTNYPRTE